MFLSRDSVWLLSSKSIVAATLIPIVPRIKTNRRMEPDDTIDAIRARGQSWTVADVDRLLVLLERFPDDPYLLDVLGDASQLVDHPTLADDFAFQCYQRAVAADPTCWTAHVSLGHWYDIAEDFPKSEQHFRKAIELGAGDQARIALASVIAQMGDRDAAFKLLDECEDSDDFDVATMRSEIADGMHDPVLADND